MSDDLNDYVERLREEAMGKLEEAVRLADASNDSARGVEARMRMFWPMLYLGRYEHSLVNFLWCVGVCERDDRLFERFQRQLLRAFGNVLHDMAKYPGVSLAEIDELFATMERFYDRAGKPHRLIHMLRATSACFTGDIGRIEAQREIWLALPPDEMTWGPADESYTLVYQNLCTGMLPQAIEAAAGLISGCHRSWQQPEACDFVLSIALFRLGRFGEAQRLHRRSYLRARRVDMLEETGFLLAFLSATDQLSRGVELLAHTLTNYLRVRRAWDRMHMLAGARVLLHRLTQVRQPHIRLLLPAEFESHRPDHRYPVGPLLEWVDGQFSGLAGQFDKRNGNTVVGDRLRSLEGLLDAVHPIAEDGK